MIQTTLQTAREAYQALRNINGYTKLSSDPAWKMSRLLNKLKPFVVDYEEAQLKLYRDSGGLEQMGGVSVLPPVKGKDEEDADFEARSNTFRKELDGLYAELRQLNKQGVEIECSPLPLSIFKDKDNTPEDRQKAFNGNDFADAGPFIVEG